MQEDNLKYLFESYSSLLMEEVAQDDIVDAIKKTYEVAITYDNDARDWRVIQPVVYGKSRQGNLVIRAYQSHGDTETTKPAWKTFRVDKINAWEPLEDRVFGPPPMYNGTDSLMTTIYIAAKFNGQEYPTEPEAERGEAPSVGRGFRNKISQVWDKLKGYKDKLFGKPQQQTQSDISGIEKQTNNTNSSSVQDMAKVDKIGSNNTTSQTNPVQKGSGQEKAVPNSDAPITNYNNVQKNGPVIKGQEPEQDNTEDEEKIISEILNGW